MAFLDPLLDAACRYLALRPRVPPLLTAAAVALSFCISESEPPMLMASLAITVVANWPNWAVSACFLAALWDHEDCFIIIYEAILEFLLGRLHIIRVAAPSS